MRQLELDTDREIEELKEDKVRMGWDFNGFQWFSLDSQCISMDFNGVLRVVNGFSADSQWMSNMFNGSRAQLRRRS